MGWQDRTGSVSIDRLRCGWAARVRLGLLRFGRVRLGPAVKVRTGVERSALVGQGGKASDRLCPVWQLCTERVR